MPLIRGAKPGSPGFKKNIKAEISAGKPQKQAVAIAYSESRQPKKDAKMKKHEGHKAAKKAHQELHKDHKKQAEHHMKQAELHMKKSKHHSEKAGAIDKGPYNEKKMPGGEDKKAARVVR